MFRWLLVFVCLHVFPCFRLDLAPRDATLTSHFDRQIEGFGSRCVASRQQGVPTSGDHHLTNVQWLHVPKCGTSFIATLWNYACGQGNATLDLFVDPYFSRECRACYDVAVKNRYSRELYCTPGVLHAHFQTAHQPTTRNLMQRGDHVVGLLRRPNQRVISAFHDAMHASGFGIDTQLELRRTCMGSVFCFASFPGISGCAARMLTGKTCAEDLGDGRDGFDGGLAVLPAALEALELMSFVGITEEWDESVCLFHLMFGGRTNDAEYLNTHTVRDRAEEYNEVDLKGFVDTADEKVYAGALRRFEALRLEYAGSASACGGASLTRPGDTGEQTCCAAAGLQCGASGTSLDCGMCPGGRLEVRGHSPGANVTCSSEGQCLVDGSPPPADLFGWHHPSSSPSNRGTF
mmetsp:Transcript_10938/g.30299  ORF Transcript_10938/g.30299 Transcript_10938/m.30299 type:complete len:405 (-) Transcript_10938:169-1383(-)